jgi:hypothetical protein
MQVSVLGMKAVINQPIQAGEAGFTELTRPTARRVVMRIDFG